MIESVLRRVFAAVALLSLALSDVVAAQQFDPRTIQQAQGALGAGQSSSSQLDASRGADANPAPQDQAAGTTSEEIELRRQRSRQQLDRLYTPTAIERDYRERLGEPDLRQFGYDLFRSTQGGSGPLTGAVGDNYMLGVGDELVVSFQGATSDSRTVRVDREGRLVVGQLPPIRAAGRSIGAVRAELQAATRRTLLGTDVYVSLGSVRSVSVFVGGEVERPGSYQTTSLGDVATVIGKAGGIRRSGSLRRIRVVHAGGGVSVVDLYGLLGIGAPVSIRLQDGDRIIVPVIGDTAAITGAVARPAIYELRGPVSLSSFVDYAGGALRSRGYKVAVSRIGRDGKETYERTATGTVLAGDAVQISGGSAGGTAGRVGLRGYVVNAGARPLSAARTVHDLLGDPADLRTGTYMPMAILKRRDPLTSATVYEPVNLLSALRDAPPVLLRGDDELFVFSQADIRFLNRPAVRRIVLGQPNDLVNCRSLERLAGLVRDTQSSRYTAIARGSFIVDRAGRTDLAAGSGAQSQNAGRNSGLEARTAVESGTIDRSNSSVDVRRQSNDNVSEDLQRYSVLPTGDRIIEETECPTVFEQQLELLPLLIENAVGVGGSVREPGAYPVAGAVGVDALTAVSGGLASGSTAIVLDIMHADARAGDQNRVVVGEDLSKLATVQLRSGDDLRVNAAQPQFEPGAVLLAGEFARPGLYAIRKGETLSQLIERAGGITQYAYPYGAIFTRRSVKQLQEEGFRRTARELKNGLLAASARKTGGAGDSIAAAGAVIDQLSSAEAVGRMVVEADPRVLAVRADLDTTLEAGDAIVMPKTPNFVLALGDVLNPGALQFLPGKSAHQYLREAGGTQQSADNGRAFLVLPNGIAGPVKSASWRRGSAVVPPGSTIIVPKNVDPLRTLDLVRDVATIFGQFATSIATLVILGNQ